MAEFKPINSQEEFDKAIAERLGRIKKQYEEKYSDYESLKDIQSKYDALSTEHSSTSKQLETMSSQYSELKNSVDKFKQDIADRDAAIETFKKNEMRIKAARTARIPLELAEKINGSTEEEMMEDAKFLSSFLGKKGGEPFYSNEPSGEPDADTELREFIKQFSKD